MNHTARPTALLALAALLALGSCNGDVDAAATGDDVGARESVATNETEAPAAVDAEQAVAQLLERANERLLLMENSDWIQVYDYVAPSIKRHQDLGRFLSNAQNHEYVLLGEPRFVGVEDEFAFVQVIVEWTPTHAQIAQAANAGQGTLTQEIDMIETWQLEDGEWYHFRSQRERDFRAEHPELFRRDDEAGPQDTQSAQAESDAGDESE